MPPILDRFRAARAQVRIEPNVETPPGKLSGSVVRLTVTLTARQSIKVSSGILDLALLTTRFARTALDGYFEHTTRDVRQTCVLWNSVAVRPGIPLARTVEVHLPGVAADDTRPVRLQWQARARFAVAGYRELLADRTICDASPAEAGAPVVDGAGFLPLYEFRTHREP